MDKLITLSLITLPPLGLHVEFRNQSCQTVALMTVGISTLNNKISDRTEGMEFSLEPPDTSTTTTMFASHPMQFGKSIGAEVPIREHCS